MLDSTFSELIERDELMAQCSKCHDVFSVDGDFAATPTLTYFYFEGILYHKPHSPNECGGRAILIV